MGTVRKSCYENGLDAMMEERAEKRNPPVPSLPLVRSLFLVLGSFDTPVVMMTGRRGTMTDRVRLTFSSLKTAQWFGVFASPFSSGDALFLFFFLRSPQGRGSPSPNRRKY